jgi:hypothetical protein
MISLLKYTCNCENNVSEYRYITINLQDPQFLLLLLQGYRPQACFRLQENASSHLAWVVRYFGILLVYNLVILLEVCLLSFLICVHANFLFAFLLSQLNWIFLILNVCLYFVFDLGQCIQLLNVRTSFQLNFLNTNFITLHTSAKTGSSQNIIYSVLEMRRDGIPFLFEKPRNHPSAF